MQKSAPDNRIFVLCAGCGRDIYIKEPPGSPLVKRRRLKCRVCGSKFTYLGAGRALDNDDSAKQ